MPISPDHIPLFFSTQEVARILNLAAKTISNRLDCKTGLIHLANTPPLQTIQIARRRLISRAVLEAWLREIGVPPPSEPPWTAPPLPEPAQPKRRRGRPRKGSAA